VLGLLRQHTAAFLSVTFAVLFARLSPLPAILGYPLENAQYTGRIFMKSSTVIVIVVGIVVVCCAVAACVLCISLGIIGSQVGGFDHGIPVKTGQLAPDFQLETLDGELISLQDYRGKPILLNFWATWCGPCQEEMPLIQNRFPQHTPNLVVLAVEEGSSRRELQDYVEDEQLTFIVLLGRETIKEQYRIYAYPTSIFIDADGVVRSIIVGSMTGSSLDIELAKIGVGD
jgi:peroxiredoxin